MSSERNDRASSAETDDRGPSYWQRLGPGTRPDAASDIVPLDSPGTLGRRRAEPGLGSGQYRGICELSHADQWIPRIGQLEKERPTTWIRSHTGPGRPVLRGVASLFDPYRPHGNDLDRRSECRTSARTAAIRSFRRAWRQARLSSCTSVRGVCCPAVTHSRFRHAHVNALRKERHHGT